MLRGGSTDAPVLADQQPPDDPGAPDGRQSKSCRRAEANYVAGIIVLGPQVRAVDVTDLASDIGHGQDHLR